MRQDCTGPHGDNHSPKEIFEKIKPEAADKELYEQEKAKHAESEATYKKIMILGIVEFIAWISFAIFIVSSFFIDSFLDSFIFALIFLGIGGSIDIYVLKNLRKKPEFFEARNDIINLLKSFKPENK